MLHFRRCYHTAIKTLFQPSNHTNANNITVNGWVRSVRRLKKIAFADIADGTSEKSLMVVMNPDESKDLTTGTCVEIMGNLKPSEGTKQALEMEAQSIKTLGPADSDYPLQKKYHSPEFLRTIPQFRWKSARNSSILRYRSYAQNAFSHFYTENHFTQVNSPIITSSDCEGAGEVFKVNSPNNAEFFKKADSYLTVSSQLHLEVYAAALSRVWNMTPAFRAEESDTNRHLSEFWMVEAEMAFTKSLNDVMSIAEGMVRSSIPRKEMATDLLESIRDQERRDIVKKRWEMVDKKEEWPRVTYTEAIEIIQNSPLKKNIKWGDDLASEHEKYLAGEIYKGPVFVTDYPTSLKPFYMKKSSDSTVACFDLLVPEFGELIGGSLREDDYNQLIQNMEKSGMNLKDMEWYTDLRKYGSFPHGGFGMGFERWISYTCGIDNIRDSIGFPRWAGSCVC